MYQISVPYQRKYFFVDLSLDDNDSDHEEVVSQDVASLPVTSTMPSSSSSTISDNHITFPSIALPELAGENARNVFSHHNNSIVGSAEEEEEEEEAKELNSAIVVDEIDCKFKNRLPANTQSWNADINISAAKAEIMPTASPVVQYSTTTCSDRKRSSFPEGHELGPQNKRQNTGSTKFTAASSAPSTKLPPSFPLPPSLPPPSPKVKKSIRFQEDTALLHIKEFCKWKPLETFLAKDPYEMEMGFLISTCQEYMYNGIVQQDRQSFFPNMITYVDYLRKKLRLSLKHSLHGYLSNFKIELEDYEKVIKPIGNNQSISSDMKPFVEFNIVSSNNCKPMQDLVQCVLVIKKDAIPHSGKLLS